MNPFDYGIIPLPKRNVGGDNADRRMLIHTSISPRLRVLCVLLASAFFPFGVAFAEVAAQADELASAQSAGATEVVAPVKVVKEEQVMDKKEEAEAREEDGDEELALEEDDASKAAVARPVTPDLVQVFGWRERVVIDGVEKALVAKLDTGALTSSIHAEEMELFERDGKKWVRFIATEPRKKDSPRTRIEAPLVRVARIKEPGGESTSREVVRLNFKIGEKKLRGDFTLNNRSNMLAPVLIGRTTIKELGWVDPGRTFLADEKIFR